MMRTALLAMGFLVLISCRYSKERNVGLIEYPGTLPGDTAVRFAPGIVSTDKFEHSAPTFSEDGLTMWWSVVELPAWKASILESTFKDGSWSPGRPVSFGDSAASDIYPFFTNTLLYFSSSRKVNGVQPPRGNRLWRVQRIRDAWSAPEPIDSAISRGGDFAPSLTDDGSLYFTHGPFRSPDWNIFVSRQGGSAKVADGINSAGYEDGAFIAPDESYVIFESDRPGGIGKSIDLYISFRSKDGEWNVPVNIGPRVNTAFSERFARVSRDGKFLFFGSNRRQVNGKPNFDIYWIRADFIDDLRDRRY